MSTGSNTEIAVGGLVLAAAAGFLIFAAQATGFGGGGAGAYELRASFRSVEGLRVGTDVRLAGVSVGSVTGVELDPKTFLAETRFTIRDGIELPDDTTAIVATEGLLGGTFLDLAPGGSPFNLEAGGEIQDTQGAVSITSLMMKFVGGAAEDVLKGDDSGSAESAE